MPERVAGVCLRLRSDLRASTKRPRFEDLTVTTPTYAVFLEKCLVDSSRDVEKRVADSEQRFLQRRAFRHLHAPPLIISPSMDRSKRHL